MSSSKPQKLEWPTGGPEGSPILLSAAQIVSAHLGRTSVPLPEVPGLIRTVFSTLLELQTALDPRSSMAWPLYAADQISKEAATKQAPAVAVEESVQRDFIVCLEDGKRLRMLKRYLMKQYGMTPERYRAKWGLPADYPMAAPAVTDQRRQAALTAGLGRLRHQRIKEAP